MRALLRNKTREESNECGQEKWNPKTWTITPPRACAVTHAMHYAAYGWAYTCERCIFYKAVNRSGRSPKATPTWRAQTCMQGAATASSAKAATTVAGHGSWKMPMHLCVASAAPRPMQAPNERLSPHPQQAASTRTAAGNEACGGPALPPHLQTAAAHMALAAAERPSSLFSRL